MKMLVSGLNPSRNYRLAVLNLTKTTQPKESEMNFNLLPKVGILAAVSFIAGGIGTATAADPYDKALEARVAALERELNLMQGDDKGKAVKPADVPTFLRAKGANVKELVMYGDLRYRWQYTNFENQLFTSPVYSHDNGNSRNRYRLRFGFEYQLTDNFFMGFALGSGADNGNDGTTASFTNGFSKQSIWIDKAYLGYKFKDIPLTIIGGKQNWAFYAIDDFVYNPADNRPEGFTEIYKLDVSPMTSIQFIAGQYIFFDNNEFNNSAGLSKGVKTDAYLFIQQVVFEFKFGGTGASTRTVQDGKTTRTETVAGAPAMSLKFGPTFQFYPNNGNVTVAGANTNPLNGITNVAGFGSAYGNATRNLMVFDMPAEFNFKLGGLAIKPYAEIAYNFQGGARAYDVYGVRADNFTDKIAWMAGVKFGDLRKKGDWSISADYRSVGVGSIDPNLNDPNWAGSRLNMQGPKIALAYRFTNWLTGNVNFFSGWNLRRDLRPSAVVGAATSPAILPAPGAATVTFKNTKVAVVPFDYNASQIIQVELNATF